MKQSDGFREAKQKVLKALADGLFQHAERKSIDIKNMLQMGEVTAEDVATIVRRCNGSHRSCTPHHWAPQIMVHVLRRDGWYIKFYFIDPHTVFISVHR